MKKIIAIILVAVSLLILNISSSTVGWSAEKYIIDAQTCESFFQCSPEGFTKKTLEQTWIKGNVSKARESNGDLILFLSKQDRQYWETHINEQIANKRKTEQENGCGLDVNEDYTKLTYSVPAVTAIEVSVNNIVSFVPCLGIMQMLNGTEPQDWHVDVEIVSADTGKIVDQMSFPREQD